MLCRNLVIASEAKQSGPPAADLGPFLQSNTRTDLKTALDKCSINIPKWSKNFKRGKYLCCRIREKAG
jgi:hypothetical protein